MSQFIAADVVTRNTKDLEEPPRVKRINVASNMSQTWLRRHIYNSMKFGHSVTLLPVDWNQPTP